MLAPCNEVIPNPLHLQYLLYAGCIDLHIILENDAELVDLTGQIDLSQVVVLPLEEEYTHDFILLKCKKVLKMSIIFFKVLMQVDLGSFAACKQNLHISCMHLADLNAVLADSDVLIAVVI